MEDEEDERSDNFRPLEYFHGTSMAMASASGTSIAMATFHGTSIAMATLEEAKLRMMEEAVKLRVSGGGIPSHLHQTVE